MDTRGIIKVEASGSEEIEADATVLHITVAGKKFRFQNAAAVKADEIRPLVEGLQRLGIDDEEIRVTSVRTSTQSGRITKTSSATFQLNILVQDLEVLPNALGLVTSIDDCTLSRTEWRFGTEDEERKSLLKKVTADAAERASIMAEVTGSSVAGIKYISDSFSAPESPIDYMMPVPASAELSRSRSAPIDIGTPFAGTKELSVVVTAEFWLNDSFGLSDKAAPLGDS